MKLFIKLLILFLLPVSNSVLSADELVFCNNCSYGQKLNLIRTYSPLKTYYVLDFYNKDIRRFDFDIDTETRPIQIIPFEVPIPQNVLSYANEFFDTNEEIVALLQNNPDLFSTLATEISSSSLEPSKTMGNLSTMSSGQCNTNALSPHDFITSTSLRTSIFDKMNNYYPIIQGALNFWNSFILESQVTLGAGNESVNFSVTTEGSFFAIPQTITFPSGGQLDAVISPSGNSFNLIEGSAMDCQGNIIPTDKQGFIGSFNFSSESAQEQFRSYGAFFGVQFQDQSCRADIMITRCVQVGENQYSCFYNYCP